MKFEYGDKVDMRVPKEVQRHITRIGGRNFYGEPNYRIVWGPSRMEILGGRFEAEEFGNPHVGVHIVPRYPAHQWVLERWVPAPCTREYWEKAYTETIDGVKIETMGPYPARGDYELVTAFPPIELNMAAADFLVQVMERSRSFSGGDRRKALEAKLEKRERDWSNDADAILDDGFPAFYGAPHVAFSSNRRF